MGAGKVTDAPALDFCLVSPGMPHDGNTLKQRSLGGSETAALCIAEALARLGHSVVAFTPGHGGMVVNGVTYLPIEQAAAYLVSTVHDVCVISRDLAAASMPTASVVKMLWCHDLALRRFRPQFTSALWNLDAVLVLSRFQYDQYAALHDVARPVLVQSRNGVDLTRFPSKPVPLERREPWKLVYGSRPERGVEALINVMRLAASRNAKWKVCVSSYDNPVDAMRPYYEQLEAAAGSVGNITMLGAKTQAEWTRHLTTARGFLYPGVNGDFSEISCLAAMEAQAAGTPVIALAKGALPETVHPDAGVLLGSQDTDVLTPAYAEQFLDAIDTLQDAARWKAMSAAGFAHSRNLDWDGVAHQWVDLARELIARRTDNAERVAKHLVRSGDREALQP